MRTDCRHVLVFSSYCEGINKVFEDYCNGIKANAVSYHYIDYIDLYLTHGKRGMERYIDAFIADHGIDCIFFIWRSCDLTFDPVYLKRLSRTLTLVMNFFDTEYFFEGVDRYYAQVADLVILPDTLARYRYIHLNIPAHTSYAMYDGKDYRRDLAIDKDIDVSFVGNLKQADRQEYIDYLKANGVRIETYGVGSDNGFASQEEMIRIFNRSRINLNFTSTSDSGQYVVAPPRINQRIQQSKGRPVEIALSGGFILSQHAPGIEEMFALEEQIDTFRTKAELLAKIQHYLAENDTRERMATLAHQRAVEHYNIHPGFKTIFALLRTQASVGIDAPLYLDPEFVRNYTAFRFFYMCGFLCVGKWGHIVEEVALVLRHRCISLSKSYYFFIRGFTYITQRRPKLFEFLRTVKNRCGIKAKY